MKTHEERTLRIPVTLPSQRKVRVIAASPAAARVRRTPASPIKGRTPTSAPQSATPLSSHDEAEQVRAILEDGKAEKIAVIPLAGKASFADYLIIASGNSTRHVASLGRALQTKLGSSLLHTEGMSEGEWVCADMGNIVIHLFIPEKRAIYNLEKLWSYVFTENPTETDESLT